MADNKDQKQDSKSQAKDEPQPGVYIVNGRKVDANGKPVGGGK